jgi:PIN domain
MFRMLIDTCVWLDLAKDQRQAPVLGAVEEMVKLGTISLIVPRVVLDEFQRNRERIAKESAKSLSGHFRVVKDAVGKIGGDKNKKRMRLVLSHLDDVGHKIPIIGGTAVDTLDRIEKLLKASPILEPSEAVTLRASQRAIEKKAPFHRDKNAMADAIIIETYAECFLAKTTAGVRFAFVTHNKSDFSIENGNHKIPHPDLAALFSRIKSLYFINLPEALRRVEPSLVTDIMLEQSWTQEPRGLTEILEAEDLLFNQVWYNRHWGLRIGVENGRIKVVDKETYPRPPGARETVQRDVWKGALESARRVERRFGKENLGPWDDFEWGMINGKLSALRWVLGDEWDMLDT